MARACAVCATAWPEEGPVPYEWDAHLVEVTEGEGKKRKTRTEMQLSCSAECRVQRGWRERKRGA